MKPSKQVSFDQQYRLHLKFKGLQPNTIEAYARAIQQIAAATPVLSYMVFFFTLYNSDLRLCEGLRMQVGDIDACACARHQRQPGLPGSR